MKRLTYEEPSPVSKEAARDVVSSGVPDEIARTLVAVALHEEDFAFALEIVLGCAVSPDPMVRGTALLCLGHLARIHRQLPHDPVVELVRNGLRDPDEYVRGQANSAADDIELFVPAVGRAIRS